ncbi:MAG: ROK family protein [Lactobacillus sp.]|nr:ROK family protein [Lactobacillus sp.]
MAEKYYGTVEAGGTKFIVAVADEKQKIVDQARVKTEDPESTINNCLDFFRKYALKSVAIGTFGPIDIDKHSETYGFIKNTPKDGWSNFDLKGAFERGLNVPVAITTDVNASAYGEFIARGKKLDKSLLYITIGTGIGGGLMQGDKFIGLNNHPEMGHMVARKHPDDKFVGGCIFHKDACFEGLAAGPTLKGRTGIPGEDLPRDHETFKFIRYYVAQLLFDIYLTARPDVMIVGGSVLTEDDMPEVRDDFALFMNGYFDGLNLDEMIVRPAVENNGSAVLGCIEMAKKIAK